VQLPLHFHTFPTTPPRARQEATQVRRAAIFTGVSAFQMGLIHIIAGMMAAGVFERYPRLRVSFGESGAGWLAYALHRMDFEFEDRFRDLMKLKPSEYWRCQCKATFQFDPISSKLIDDIGVETMMGARTTRTPTVSGPNPPNTSRSNSRAIARGGPQDHLRERAKFYGLISPSPTSCCRRRRRRAGECPWRPPGSLRRRCGGRIRSGACRPPPSRGQALEPVNRLAVALAVCVVHRGEQVGRPSQLELDDGHPETGMTLEDAGEDQIAQ
jgi:hypothetical protein